MIQEIDQPQVVTAKITSYESYLKYASHFQAEYDEREQYESSIIVNSESFTTGGSCYICKKKVELFADYLYSYMKNGHKMLNWRERLVCNVCGLNNRMRASIHLFEHLLHPERESKIYISEQTTLLYKWFVNNYPNVVGSEYLGNTVPLGNRDKNGIRNETFTKLSFPDSQFDFILSFDVFEHIPDFQKAFRECLRVLKPNGILFFSVPFEINSEKNIVRAVIKDTDTIEHLLPSEYHGDPINSKGCLSFYHFGWEMLRQLREINSTNVQAYLYWSKEFGYLGANQTLFVAEKNNIDHKK